MFFSFFAFHSCFWLCNELARVSLLFFKDQHHIKFDFSLWYVFENANYKVIFCMIWNCKTVVFVYIDSYHAFEIFRKKKLSGVVIKYFIKCFLNLSANDSFSVISTIREHKLSWCPWNKTCSGHYSIEYCNN